MPDELSVPAEPSELAASEAGWATPAAPPPDPRPRRRQLAPVLALLFVAVLGGAAIFLSGYVLGARVATTPGTPPGEEAAWEPFWDAYRAITDQYVGTIDRKGLVEGAIDGMVKSLGDRFSSYMTSEQYRQSLQGISGRFSGIGTEMQAQPAPGGQPCQPLGPQCRLTVMSVVPGAPADKAGILAGDAIIAIDGTSLDGRTTDQATALIRGPKGQPVTLTIARGSEPARDVTIVRDYIARPEVTSRALADGKVGYIRLSGFSDASARAFASAVSDFAGKGITEYVVDLRGNGGGFVTAARDVASQFIASGPIFWQEDATGQRIEISAQPGGAATGQDVRVAVLVDGDSASASEIVAGALQDTHRATLVGTKTYGKGTIQEWLPLPDDYGGMRLTVLRWLTPDGTWIHTRGLLPDVPVDAGAAPAAGSATGDATLDRALEVLAAPRSATTGVQPPAGSPAPSATVVP